MSAAAKEKAELPNEPDRLTGFAAPREVAKLVGHEIALAEFEAALASGRLHHAWLLTGPEGIGKATLAYKLARLALARESSDRSEEAGEVLFRKVAALSHPNLFVLKRAWNEKSKRFSQTIGVEEVRRMRAFLASTAGARGYRVVLVDRADELNQNAANALLKLLEEPPAKTLFLLVSAAEGRLPITIRSRCRMLRLNALPEPELETGVRSALEEAEIDLNEETLAQALSLSGGSVRRALELATGEGIVLYRELIRMFEQLPEIDAKELTRIGDQLSGAANSDRAELFFSLLAELIERLVRLSVVGAEGTAAEKALAARLVGPNRAAAWAEAWEEIGRSKQDAFALNLDRGLLLAGTMLRLRELAQATKD